MPSAQWLAEKLGGTRHIPGRGMVRDCPSCENWEALCISKDGHSIDLVCSDGCAPEAIVKAAGLSPQQVFNGKPKQLSAYPASDNEYLLRVICAADVQTKPVEWLWRNRIPLGKLTLVGGDPGVGKSFLCSYFASRVSAGKVWPITGDRCAPRNVVYMAAEDGAEDTTVPRLEMSGAAKARVFIIPGAMVSPTQGRLFFSLQEHLDVLEQTLLSIGEVGLLMIDTLTLFSGRTDMNTSNESSQMLASLAEMVERVGCSCIAITHLNKGDNQQAIYRILGSISVAGGPRAVWGVFRDKTDPKRRMMLPIKVNNASDLDTGLAYRLVDGPEEVGWVEWEEEEIQGTANDIVLEQKMAQGGEKKQQCMKYIETLLKDGPMDASYAKKQCKEAGFQAGTIEIASKELGVIVSGRGRHESWSIEEDF